MDEAPNTRPFFLPSLTAAAVLLAVLSALFFNSFSADQTLRMDRTFPSGESAWDANFGLGKPEPEIQPGSKAVIYALCKLSDHPARTFSNVYAPVSLFLLGMAAWFCLRQWGCTSAACLLGALAASLNGVFFTTTVGYFSPMAISAAWAFVALGLVRYRPRLDWPVALLAGVLLSMATLEAGPTVGLIFTTGISLLAFGLAREDDSQNLIQRLKAGWLLPVTVVAFGVWGIPMDAFGPERGEATNDAPLKLFQLPGIVIAGLTGHRLQSIDSTGQWGSVAIWGMYAGIPTLMLAAWALVHALHRKSILAKAERHRVIAFCICTVVAGLLGLLHPMCMAVAGMSLVMLAGLGAGILEDWNASEAHENTRAFGSGGFDTAWRLGSIGVVILASIGFAIYSSRGDSLAQWMQAEYRGMTPELSTGIASASIWQAGMAVMFMALTVAAFLVCGMLKWTPRVRAGCFAVLGVLLLVDLSRSGRPYQQYDVRSDSPSGHPVVQHIKQEPAPGRLALLNQFELPRVKDSKKTILPVDRWLIEKYLATTVSPIPKIEDPKVEKVVHAFHQAVAQYNDPEQLDAFQKQIQRMMSSEQGAPIEREMSILSHMPAGREFLASEGNQGVINFFRHIILQQLGQLRHAQALRDTVQLGNVHHRHWLRNQFARPPIARSPVYYADSEDENNRTQLLRWWELNSVKYFLCVSGNLTIGKSVQDEFPYLSLPIYEILPNYLLDPSQRRFSHQQDYALDVDTAQLTAATNGPVALLEFEGALLRLKLFADWQSGVEDEQAEKLLFQPGFNPHQQVLLKETIDAPEHPSQTSSLPAPEIIKLESDRVELKIPPTQFATVLLFNDAHHPGWTVTRNGKPASLLRANAAMRAVHLPAAEKGQTVVFQFQPATASTMPFWVLLILSLPAFIMMWRER